MPAFRRPVICLDHCGTGDRESGIRLVGVSAAWRVGAICVGDLTDRLRRNNTRRLKGCKHSVNGKLFPGFLFCFITVRVRRVAYFSQGPEG